MFDEIYGRTVGLEGDFANDKNDPGGKTRFGITEAVARANGYTGDMKDLPYPLAVKIAKSQYWDVLRLDDIGAASRKIAEELFDTSYNMGVGIAGRFLQRALNAFNHEQKDYKDVVVDGVVGPMTVQSLKQYIAKRGAEGETIMLRALNSQQGERYLSIVESRPASEDFTFGWFRARVS